MSIAWLIVLVAVEILNGPTNVELLAWLLLVPFIVQDSWDGSSRYRFR